MKIIYTQKNRYEIAKKKKNPIIKPIENHEPQHLTHRIFFQPRLFHQDNLR